MYYEELYLPFINASKQFTIVLPCIYQANLFQLCAKQITDRVKYTCPRLNVH